MSQFCTDCTLFEEHMPEAGKNPDNCVKWLCNCNTCPHDAEIAEANKKDEDRRCTAPLCRY